MTNPQPGDFCVLPISGQVGTLISIGEWLNGSAFNHFDHAEIYVGNNQTMGAYPGGATLVPLPANQNDYLWSTGHILLSDAERKAIVANAMACKGIPYNWPDYFYLAALRLHIPAPGVKSYMDNPKSLICSQLVDWCYMQAGVHLFNDGRLPGAVTPADLAKVIQDSSGITRG